MVICVLEMVNFTGHSLKRRTLAKSDAVAIKTTTV